MTTEEKKNSNVTEEQSTTKGLNDHDPKGSAREEMVLLMQQSNKNVVDMGATCADRRIHAGSPMIDKESKQHKINPQTNEPMFYADKYYVTLTFDGGSIETEVEKGQYDLLIVGKRYSCYGRLAPVRVFGNEQIMPVFHAFTELY